MIVKLHLASDEPLLLSWVDTIIQKATTVPLLPLLTLLLPSLILKCSGRCHKSKGSLEMMFHPSCKAIKYLIINNFFHKIKAIQWLLIKFWWKSNWCGIILPGGCAISLYESVNTVKLVNVSCLILFKLNIVASWEKSVVMDQ